MMRNEIFSFCNTKLLKITINFQYCSSKTRKSFNESLISNKCRLYFNNDKYAQRKKIHYLNDERDIEERDTSTQDSECLSSLFKYNVFVPYFIRILMHFLNCLDKREASLIATPNWIGI
jgi:hypothetical protein